MRPLSVQYLRNIRNPLQFVDWARYQFSRGKDVYLSTLTSSGTHWLRFLIAKVIVDAHDLGYAFTDIRPESLVPIFRDKTVRFDFNDYTEFSRFQHRYKPYSVLLRGGRVIVPVRDLRDTMVSSYDTYSEHKDSSITFSEFLRADGVDEKWHRTLEWRIDLPNQWHRNWDNVDDHLSVKYEALKGDTQGVTHDVLEFIRLDNVSDALVTQVTEFCDIDQVRRTQIFSVIPTSGSNRQARAPKSIRERPIGTGTISMGLTDAISSGLSMSVLKTTPVTTMEASERQRNAGVRGLPIASCLGICSSTAVCSLPRDPSRSD
ncbi:hypothetical protein B9H04_12945 [Halorubrum ezzemoulense DSM 17463]|uniref:Sulfotransferase domain-containing protein n=1 Tax=Halorubrum ezzemoulense DSM 17463 TaxID=1121945 RepID=A0A1X4GJX4_HALEZ|nr:sulfotransferase domain-containing protein [Halorubrum ezzemoulense]OSO97481.1 hypothetical protein B9H04_12945 [Halorubrum ezzemoulense DSM 17463]